MHRHAAATPAPVVTNPLSSRLTSPESHSVFGLQQPALAKLSQDDGRKIQFLDQVRDV
jgi:hypothetical protein